MVGIAPATFAAVREEASPFQANVHGNAGLNATRVALCLQRIRKPQAPVIGSIFGDTHRESGFSFKIALSQVSGDCHPPDPLVQYQKQHLVSVPSTRAVHPHSQSPHAQQAPRYVAETPDLDPRPPRQRP